MNENLNRSAVLEANGKTYFLKEGENLVGRKSPFSIVDVQIESIDHTISRYCCKITVFTAPDGTKKAILKKERSKSPIFVNKIQVLDCDTLWLHDGTEIQLGTTVLTFRLL
jgi:hypothetical protein